MTAYKIVVTNAADKDEASIYSYIADKFGVVYADNFRNKLLRILKLLSNHPHLGRPAKRNAGVRVYIFQQNKIVYCLKDDSLIVVRVLDMRTKIAGKF